MLWLKEKKKGLGGMQRRSRPLAFPESLASGKSCIMN